MRVSDFCLIPITALMLGASALPAAAATEQVLSSFAYNEPEGRLLFHEGALYGTAVQADGQVFKLIQSGGSWKRSPILKFDYLDGSQPYNGLISDSRRHLYGVTHIGGKFGSGIVFELSYSVSGGSWTEQVLYSFTGGGDGQQPYCDLIMDSSGNLYGTTFEGGSGYYGTVFELSYSGGSWNEQVLYSFKGGSDAAYPEAGLHLDSSGVLYGTTVSGGAYNSGTVFELSQSGGVWTESVLHSFGGSGDGTFPYSVLVQSPKGKLFGTTESGGASGNGTVFELTQSGGVWTETVLYSFKGGSDGANPYDGLHWGRTGTLYGTTDYGGGSIHCTYGPGGCGTVFELTQSDGLWSETVLHSFGARGDGQNPYAAVILDKSGNLYGTTLHGGAYRRGTVWEVTP